MLQSHQKKFFEFTITKDQKIIWNIDLSHKDDLDQKIKLDENHKPQNLLELAQDYIEEIDKNVQDLDLDSIYNPKASKSIRKMVKKILKMKNIRLSELSSDIGVKKTNLKIWLKNAEKDENDENDYDYLLKNWLLKEINILAKEEKIDLIYFHNKSLMKHKLAKAQNLNNINPIINSLVNGSSIINPNNNNNNIIPNNNINNNNNQISSVSNAQIKSNSSNNTNGTGGINDNANVDNEVNISINNDNKDNINSISVAPTTTMTNINAHANPKINNHHDQQKIENDIESILIDTDILHKKKIKKEHDINNSQNLHLIKIDVNEGNIHIRDMFIWDCTEDDQDMMLICSFKLVKDYILENNLSPDIDQINALLNKISQQIQDQTQSIMSLIKNKGSLLGFNANSTQYYKNETIIQIKLAIEEDGIIINDKFDWEITSNLNDPDEFSRVYTIENNLPEKFLLLISTQIKRQIVEYLEQTLNNLTELYEAKLNEKVTAEINPRKAGEYIKNKILYSLNESFECCPAIVSKPNDRLFLQNPDLISLLNKYSDTMNHKYKYIFDRQRTLFQKSVSQANNPSGYLARTGEKRIHNNLSHQNLDPQHLFKTQIISNKDGNSALNKTPGSNNPIGNSPSINNPEVFMNSIKNIQNMPGYKKFSNVSLPNVSQNRQNNQNNPALNFSSINNFRNPTTNWQMRPQPPGMNMGINNRYLGMLPPFSNVKNFMNNMSQTSIPNTIPNNLQNPQMQVSMNQMINQKIGNTQGQLYTNPSSIQTNKLYHTQNILPNGMNGSRK